MSSTGELVLAEVGFQDVLAHHALRVEEGSVQGDAIAHDLDEVGSSLVEEG